MKPKPISFQQPVLEMHQITKTFPGVTALNSVSLDLLAGEVHVLLGENGAGKSTLMKILSGACQKDSGRIHLYGKEVDIYSPRHAQDLGIGIIYQELNLVPSLSAAENIFLAREPATFLGVIDRKKLHIQARELLDNLNVTIDSRVPTGKLGVAQQQMIEIAKAFSVEARILIMDEPTSSLTNREIARLFATIRELKARGTAVIYISHRLEELFEIGDRVTVLRDGEVMGTHDIRDVSREDLIQMMANRRLNDQYPKRNRQSDAELMRVEGLKAVTLPHEVSFSLRKGEILGIAGLMGAGRTALARVLFGLDTVTGGTVTIKGRRRTIRAPRDAINLGIGFLTEDRKSEGLVLTLSVQENIALPSLDRYSRFGIIGLAGEAETAQRYVDELRIKTPGLKQKVMFLSGGNQQKVVLSKWLCSRADIFIFDEPTRGIDVGAKFEIYQLMNQLTESGVAIIMISSEIEEILGMSDRILVMYEGRVTGEFSAVEATQELILSAALGEEHGN